MNTARCKDFHLGGGSISFSTYDGACVTHFTAFRCSFTGNEPNYGLGTMVTDPISCLRLHTTSYFTNHDDPFSSRVFHQKLNCLKRSSPANGVSPNTNTSRLTQSGFCDLVYSLICQCTRPGNNSNRTRTMNEARHDPDFSFSRSNNARAIRAY